jgi:hypothetical protein
MTTQDNDALMLFGRKAISVPSSFSSDEDVCLFVLLVSRNKCTIILANPFH